MPEFSENIRLIALELFDAAFPVPPDETEATKQRFMTLFEHESHKARGGSATVFRVTNLYGETFALKRLHVAKRSDEKPAAAPAHSAGISPADPSYRTSRTVGRGSSSDSSGEALEGGVSDYPDGAGADGRPLRKELRSAFQSTSSDGASLPQSATPDYVTQGHVAALYEEYRVHQAVSHLRGYPKLYGFGLSAGDPVIVMEWVEGVSLRDCVKEATIDGPLPLQAVADLGIAVLTLLARAGELNEQFVHRDLSPRNIMLRTDRVEAGEQLRTGSFDLCLIDFGSSSLGASGDPSFTQNKDIWRMGTPSYAPPEMLSADIALPETWRRSETIDTYALCSVLYELYTGRRPFDLSAASGQSPYRVKTETAPAPIAVREPDGGALANIIASGLSVQQEDRPTIAQLKAALENWKRLPARRSVGTLRGTRPTDASFWQPGYARKAVSRRSFAAAGIVAVAAIASGAIIARKAAPAVDAIDTSRYAVADETYSGPPLFKALDGKRAGWMLCSADGSVACRPDSSRACGPLREGLAALYDDASQRYGYITPLRDGSGGYAWAILPAYAQADEFSEGLAAVQERGSLLWGFVDAGGEWVIAPQFRAASAFSNGAAAAQVNDGDTLWGAIDASGNWLVEPRFASLGARSAEGYAVAEQVGDGEVGGSDADDSASDDATDEVQAGAHARWGIVDAKGDWSCAARFARLRSCASGPAPALDTETELWGFVDSAGEWVVAPRFMDARPFRPFANGSLAASIGDDASSSDNNPSSENNNSSHGDILAAVQDPETQLWYFVDPNGEAHGGMEPRFWKLGDLHDGLAPAQASAKDSTVVIDGADGSTRVRGAGMRYGYVNAAGEWAMKRLTTLADTAIGVPEI